MRRINPLNDFAFKKILGEVGKEVELMAFLNAILHKTLRVPITEITIVEHKELPKDLFSDKPGIVDIRAILADGTIVNIEIQLNNQYNMQQRTLFYWSKLYADAIEKGENYRALPKVITINILDFNLLPTQNYHSIYHIWNDEEEHMLSEVLEIHFIEYPKFRKIVGDNYDINSEARWLTLLQQNVEPDTIQALMTLEPAMANVEKTLNFLSSSKDMIYWYKLQEKARIDSLINVHSAQQEGIEIGIEKGIEQGVQIEKINTAKQALSEGIDVNIIAKISGLPVAQILQLQADAN